jgi:hypothetical protein
MPIKYQEILIRNNRNKKIYCDIFSYEPETIEEMALGGLYIVSELQSEEDPSRLANLLNSIIKREYYYSPHRGALESLEISLKKANMSLNEIAQQGNLSWLGKLHLVCAVINKQDLFLSQTGEAQAWLCREGEITDITKKCAENPVKPHPAKIFQNVVSGKIELHDKFLLATPAFSSLFNNERFKETIRLPKIEDISERINAVAKEQKKIPPFGTLLIEMQPEENIEIPKKKGDFITPPINLDEVLK